MPLAIGAVAFTLLTTWARGRKLMRDRMAEVELPLDIFAKSAHASTQRVPGTAIFMSAATKGVPSALLHNIKHNKVLHERVVVLTVNIREVPFVDPDERVRDAGSGPGLLPPDPQLRLHGGNRHARRAEGSRHVRRQVRHDADQLLPLAPDPDGLEDAGNGDLAGKLFSWMLRNAATPMDFFRLPTNRVVELGSQLEI